MSSLFVAVFLFSAFFFFKQKTAYEMRISDWSSDVCSSDLQAEHLTNRLRADPAAFHPGVRDRLIEDRQPVARRTFGGAGDQRQRFGQIGRASCRERVCQYV